MASQEHLAMLEEDDTTTSTSSNDNDLDDDDDEETSSENGDDARGAPASSIQAVLGPDATPPMGISTSNLTKVEVSKNENPSPPLPAKKRLKLGFRLPINKNRKKDAGAMEVDAAPVELLSPSIPASEELEAAVAVEATPISIPSTNDAENSSKSSRVSSSTKRLKLVPKKYTIERASTEGTDATEDGVVKAMVVDSDDGGEDDAIAAVVEEPVPTKTKSSAQASATSTAKSQRRQANSTIKPVRLPPMSSPGLLIPPGVSGPFRSIADASTGLATPASVFDHAMSLAGYTTESRMMRPHRGSSIRREVGDMFDSNVKFTLHFPTLVPEDLMIPSDPLLGAPGANEANPTKKNGDVENCKVNVLPNGETTIKDENDENGKPHTRGATLSLAYQILNAFGPSTESQLQMPSHQQHNSMDVDAPSFTSDHNSETNNWNLSSSSRGDSTRTNRPGIERRKRKLPGFHEMAPLTLTLAYPEEYIQKRLEYIEKVNQREKAIIAYQEEELSLDKEKERREMMNEAISENFVEPSIVIPPIPEPPSPPRISEIENVESDLYEDQHPLYLSKAGPQQSQMKHLDSNCFHITDGRYFGLLTNAIADPHFVGPNAPGLGGLNQSGGTGLATANSGGGGSSGGATLLAAPSQFGASVNANPSKSKEYTKSKDIPSSGQSTKWKDAGKKDSSTGDSVIARKGNDEKQDSSNTKSSNSSNNSSPSAKMSSNDSDRNSKVASPISSPSAGSTVAISNSTSGNKKKSSNGNGPTATGTSSELRRIVEEGGEMAEKIRKVIVRAAVHASRRGNHTRNFRTPNGKVYPDISKAFAQHAGLKPCERCKNNKQGAYHCRLRRKHKELDYDGGDSWGILAPLFEVPMEELLFKSSKSGKPIISSSGADTEKKEGNDKV